MFWIGFGQFLYMLYFVNVDIVYQYINYERLLWYVSKVLELLEMKFIEEIINK